MDPEKKDEPLTTSVTDPMGNETIHENTNETPTTEPSSVDNKPQTPKKLSKQKLIIGGLICLVIIAAGGYYLWSKNQKAKAPSATKKEEVTIHFFSGELPDAESGTHIHKVLEEFTKKTGIKVVQDYPPATVQNFTDTGEYILKDIKQTSPTLDVFIVDGTWTGWFSDHLLDLKPHINAQLKDHFASMVDAATVDGKVIASPYFQDVSLLYYRTDLLEKYGYKSPPKTWDELEAMARKIQAGERKTNPNFWGYLWEGDESESLTATALEMQNSYGGGTIIDNNKITVNNPATIQGLTKLKSWIGVISPESVLRSTEEDALASWTAGNAAFMRNWTYAYPVSQEENSSVKDKINVVVLPSGTKRHTGTLGGEYIGVAKRSKHSKEAIELAKYLTSAQVQKDAALTDGMIPTLTDLYHNSEIQQAIPYYKELEIALAQYGVNRPGTAAGQHYNEISTDYAATMHNILAGKGTAASELATLESTLKTLSGLPSGTP